MECVTEDGMVDLGSEPRAVLAKARSIGEMQTFEVLIHKYGSNLVNVAFQLVPPGADGFIAVFVQWSLSKKKGKMRFLVANTSFQYPGHTMSYGPRVNGEKKHRDGSVNRHVGTFEDVLAMLDILVREYDKGCQNTSCSGLIHQA